MRCLGHYTDLERGSKKQDFRVLGSLEDKPNKSPATNMGRDDNKSDKRLHVTHSNYPIHELPTFWNQIHPGWSTSCRN